MGLDSLSNNIVQKAIALDGALGRGSVCGAIYNFYAKPREVCF